MNQLRKQQYWLMVLTSVARREQPVPVQPRPCGLITLYLGCSKAQLSVRKVKWLFAAPVRCAAATALFLKADRPLVSLGSLTSSSFRLHSGPVTMYIYRSMADGIPREHEEALDENMRVIEVEGKPTAVLGIRYKAATDAPPPIGIARTASGKSADTGPQIDELEQQEYWADRPGGICGGTRLTSTFREELLVSLDASSHHSYHLYSLVVSVSRVVCGRVLSSCLVCRKTSRKSAAYGICSKTILWLLLQLTGERTECQASVCFWKAMWYAV